MNVSASPPKGSRSPEAAKPTEKQLRRGTDKLRKNIAAAEDKHIGHRQINPQDESYRR